jgi:threonine dehydrogenase-like Zn-dependent dehydrogenase
VVRVDKEDLYPVVAEVSSGEMAAVVVDTTPGVSRTINDAVELAQHGGRVVLCGMKHEPINGLDSYKIIIKDLNIKCGVAASHDSYAQAVAMVSSHYDRVSQLQTHRVALDQAERGLGLLAGEDSSEAVISVSLIP